MTVALELRWAAIAAALLAIGTTAITWATRSTNKIRKEEE